MRPSPIKLSSACGARNSSTKIVEDEEKRDKWDRKEINK